MLFVIFMGKLRITSLLLLNYVVMLASLKHDLQHVLQQLGEEFEMAVDTSKSEAFVLCQKTQVEFIIEQSERIRSTPGLSICLQ